MLDIGPDTALHHVDHGAEDDEEGQNVEAAAQLYGVRCVDSLSALVEATRGALLAAR